MFTVQYGKQTFGGSTDSVSIHAFPLIQGQDWKDKSPINALFTKAGRNNSALAARDGFVDHGKWYANNLEVRDGANTSCLAITLTRRFRGTVRAQCTFHVVPSEGGPSLNVFASLTMNDNSVMGEDICVFSGKGYIINTAGLKEMGVEIKRGDISHFMDEEELEDEFRIDAAPQENYDMPKVMQIEKTDGTVSTVIAAPAAKRKLRIRKR